MKTIFTILFLSLALNCASQNQTQWQKLDKDYLTAPPLFTLAGIAVAGDIPGIKNPELAGAAAAFTACLGIELLANGKLDYYETAASFVSCVSGIFLNRLLQKIPEPKWVERERKKWGLTVVVRWDNRMRI